MRLPKAIKAHFTSIFGGMLVILSKILPKTICTAWTGGRFIFAPNQPLKTPIPKINTLKLCLCLAGRFVLNYLGWRFKTQRAGLGKACRWLVLSLFAMAVLKASQLETGTDKPYHAQWALQYCFLSCPKSIDCPLPKFPDSRAWFSG